MGDVPPDQSTTPRDGPPERKFRSGASSRSARGQSSAENAPEGPPQSTRSTQPLHQNLKPSGTEYLPASHGYQSGNHGTRSAPLNMSDMSSALPPYHSPNMAYGPQAMHPQFIPSHQSQGMMYPGPHMPFPNQGPASAVYNIPSYSPAYQNPYTQNQHPQLAHGTPGFQPYLPNPASHATSGPIPGQTSLYNPSYYHQHPYTPPFGLNQAIQGHRLRQQPDGDYYGSEGDAAAQVPLRREGEARQSVPAYDVSQTIVDGSSPMKASRARLHVSDTVPQRSPVSTIPSTPRGPPRKPKQSGHALWVGNLPPGASVVDVKDHFARDATLDIESVFLISKSNCAFVNYKTAAACTAAMARFHDSKFHGVRLVCRLRKGLTVPGAGNNLRISPSSRGESEMTSPHDQQSGEALRPRREETSAVGVGQTPSRVPDRFFIVKSLTVEDLALSRQSGIWATQSHNEAILNQAFESADNVYLFFSANKSGEYFGYARMVSPISDDEALALEMPPRPENLSVDTENFDITPTEPTATAPKGRIIDDTARGTIFWEADSSEDDEENDDDHNDDHDSGDDEDEDEAVDGDAAKSEKSAEEVPEENAGLGTQSFGKPFRIEWMSTNRVPFYRTRGLRNAWNANREVKIARDGTEIEPSAGKKLTQLFHMPSTTSSSGPPQSRTSASY